MGCFNVTLCIEFRPNTYKSLYLHSHARYCANFLAKTVIQITKPPHCGELAISSGNRCKYNHHTTSPSLASGIGLRNRASVRFSANGRDGFQLVLSFLAVAAARLDGHWLTLDNRRMAMIEDAYVRNYRPTFVIDHHGVMQYVDAQLLAVAPSAPSNRSLSAWSHLPTRYGPRSLWGCRLNRSTHQSKVSPSCSLFLPISEVGTTIRSSRRQVQASRGKSQYSVPWRSSDSDRSKT